MPQSRKINREKVLASLNKACPKCGFTITPDLVKPVDFEWIELSEMQREVPPNLETGMTPRVSGSSTYPSRLFTRAMKQPRVLAVQVEGCCASDQGIWGALFCPAQAKARLRRAWRIRSEGMAQCNLGLSAKRRNPQLHRNGRNARVRSPPRLCLRPPISRS
jgi:hypothetical protein